MIAQLDKLYADFTAKLSTLRTQSDVLNLKSEYMGKKGPLTEVLKGLKDATPDERQKIGPKANEIKQNIGSDIQAKLDGLEVAEINAKLALDPIDTTITDNVLVNDPKHGGLHPITASQ